MVQRHWYFAVWFPLAVVSWFAVVWLFVFTSDGLPMPRGPGGSGEGILVAIIWGLRLVAILLAVLSVVFRPRGDAWNLKCIGITVALGLALVGGASLVVPLVTGVTVQVQAKDTNGKLLPGVSLEYRWAKRTFVWLSEGRGTAITDANGIATIHVPQFMMLTVYGEKKLHPTHELALYSESKTTWKLIHSVDGDSTNQTYQATPSKGSSLNMTMEFDPPPQK